MTRPIHTRITPPLWKPENQSIGRPWNYSFISAVKRVVSALKWFRCECWDFLCRSFCWEDFQKAEIFSHEPNLIVFYFIYNGSFKDILLLISERSQNFEHLQSYKTECHLDMRITRKNFFKPFKNCKTFLKHILFAGSTINETRVWARAKKHLI